MTNKSDEAPEEEETEMKNQNSDKACADASGLASTDLDFVDGALCLNDSHTIASPIEQHNPLMKELKVRLDDELYT